MVEVNWTNRALDDMANIARFISEDSEKYSKLQINRFFKRVEILETFPLSGKIVVETNKEIIRELIEGNYRIIYKIISPERIDIITVHHGSKLFRG